MHFRTAAGSQYSTMETIFVLRFKGCFWCLAICSGKTFSASELNSSIISVNDTIERNIRARTQNRLAWIPSFSVVVPCSIFSLHRLNLLLIPCISQKVDHTTMAQGSVLAYRMSDFKSFRDLVIYFALIYHTSSNLHRESSVYWFTVQEL